MVTLEERLRKQDIVLFDASLPVLFVPATLGVFCLTPQAARALRLIKDGMSVDAAAKNENCAPEQLQRFVERTVEAIDTDSQRTKLTTPRTLKSAGRLPQLVFMVNNFCNLKCRYCYEHENVFTEPPKTLSTDLARATIDSMTDLFSEIGRIMFIGGEPALCEDLLYFICEYATATAERKGQQPPSFCMISNGTKMSPRLVETISRFHVQITFSVDGPPIIHDQLRIHHDNTPSSKAILSNIRLYRQLEVAPVAIECTVTSVHRRSGVSISSLLEYFGNEFGVQEAHVAVAGLPSDSPLKPEREGTDYLSEFEESAIASVNSIFDRMMGGSGRGVALDLVSSMLRRLISKEPNVEMCPAGTAQLVVDSAGDLYPCWMFAGDSSYRIGNISAIDGEAALNSPVLKRIHANSKDGNQDCQSCFARHLCNACLGNNRINTGAIETMSPAFCDTVRAITKQTVAQYAQVSRRQDVREYLAGGNAMSHVKASGCDAVVAKEV